MGLHTLLLPLGAAILAFASVSALPQESRQNLTNLRQRLPQMVAELGATTYEVSEEVSTSTRPSKQQFKRLIAPEEGVEYQNYQGVMGRPGVDFPVMPSIPRTDFTCKKVNKSGYYADLDTDCQVFHICDQGRKISFLCPNGTIFRQSHLICDWWWTVDCAGSVDLYESSAEQLAHDQRQSAASARQRASSSTTSVPIRGPVGQEPASARQRAPSSTTSVPIRGPVGQEPASFRQGKQYQQATTAQPRGANTYNNIRVNYGPTGGEEKQVLAESASFVNNKNQFRHNQFSQQHASSEHRSLDGSEMNQQAATEPPMSPSANQPSLVQSGDEDVFSSRARGPPTRQFYMSTSTEAVPITDIVQPSGDPFTAEEQPALTLANSDKVKPVYVHVTTKEGRLATSTQPPSSTESATSPGEQALAEALATLGPHLSVQYATTTQSPPITDVVQPAGVPFRDEDFGNYNPFVPPEPPKPSDTELPPFSEPPPTTETHDDQYTTQSPPITEGGHSSGDPSNDELTTTSDDDEVTLIEFESSKTAAPPGDSDENHSHNRRPDFPPIFDIIQPSGPPFTFEDNYASRVNNGLESASLVTEASPKQKPKPPTTYVEYDRYSKELKFVTTQETPTTANSEVKTRADELHNALDVIAHGKSLDSALLDTLKSSPDAAPPLPSSASRIGAQRSFTATSQEPLYTTLLPPDINDNDIVSNSTLEIENSRIDGVTVDPSSENSIQEQNVHTSGDRTGLEIPTSSGPAVLHSLAVYFGDKTELSTTPTSPEEAEILQPAFSINAGPALGVQAITDDQKTVQIVVEDNLSGPAPELLTQFTKDSYEALFPETVKDKVSEETSGDEILQRQSSGSGLNELNYNSTSDDLTLRKSVNSADLRELAQVFSRALSAYLEDPEEFRKVLSEVRPTPPTDYADNRTAGVATPANNDREEDEVLEYSDDVKPNKRPLIQKLFTKQESSMKKNAGERKGKIIPGPFEQKSYVTPYPALPTDPTRNPDETLQKSQSAYYSQNQRRFGGNQIAGEIPTVNTNTDDSLTDYNLPAGTQQYKGPGYGPQYDNERTTTEDTTVAEVTTPPPETTTYQPVNSYDGYIIPVLNTDLTPPFEPEYAQNNDLERLAGSFKPQDLNNLAIVVADLPTTTETPTTPAVDEAKEGTTNPPTSEFIIRIAPREEATTTPRPAIKSERQGRRLSFTSRSNEAGESLVRANTASFTSNRYGKESVNQWNTLNRFDAPPPPPVPPTTTTTSTTTQPRTTTSTTTTTPAPTRPRSTTSTTTTTTSTTTTRPTTTRPRTTTSTTTTTRPTTTRPRTTTSTTTTTPAPTRPRTTTSTTTTTPTSTRPRSTTRRPGARRRLKTTSTEVTSPPVVEYTTVITTPSVRVVDNRSEKQLTTPRSAVTTGQFIETRSQIPTVKNPSFQRKSKASLPKSDKIVYGTKVSTEGPRARPTYLPEPTTPPTPMEMEAMMMFGKLNASSIDHLMDVMKMAESNTTIRRLVLLLVNHGADNKTTEESRRNLIEALLTTPDELPLPESASLLNGDLQQINETTSMKVSMTVGTSSKTTTRKGKTLIGSSVRMTMNEASGTTTQVPVTTYRNNAKRVVYKATVPSTTKRPAERKTATPAPIKTSAPVGTLSVEADNRAVDLLRSLYSLAARWG